MAVEFLGPNMSVHTVDGLPPINKYLTHFVREEICMVFCNLQLE